MNDKKVESNYKGEKDSRIEQKEMEVLQIAGSHAPRGIRLRDGFCNPNIILHHSVCDIFGCLSVVVVVFKEFQAVESG